MDHPHPWNLEAIRSHFLFPAHGRVVTNNAASTQPPRALLALYQALAPAYDNVHRGQSDASQITTERFEAAYDDIARFIGAPSRRNIVVVRNTTEAHNTVMYSLMSEFRDGDNVVTTMMEHNSNYVPWYAMCRDILPRFGRRVEYRLARFDPATGELDLEHLASLIDERTKLVCCTGASNFFGTKNPLAADPRAGNTSGYATAQRRAALVPAGRRRPAGARQLHRRAGPRRRLPVVLVPQDAGAVRRRRAVCQGAPAAVVAAVPLRRRHDRRGARVPPTTCDYNALPWKFAAGTPNILGTIVSAQALRILLDLALTPQRATYFNSARAIDRRRRAGRDAAHRRLEPHAHRACARAAGRGARPHDLRPARRVAPQLAGGVQRRRPQPDGAGRGAERARHRVARGLPLRDAGAPAARASRSRPAAG